MKRKRLHKISHGISNMSKTNYMQLISQVTKVQTQAVLKQMGVVVKPKK